MRTLNHKISDRERYYTRKKQGICTRCGTNKARIGKTLCQICQIKHDKVTKKSLSKRLLEDPFLKKRKYQQSQINLRRYSVKLKELVIKKYGGKCQCCGETEPIFLTIDHVNNDGAIERKKRREYGNSHYRRLLNEDLSQNYQLLCRNCNWGKFVKGICPHKTS